MPGLDLRGSHGLIFSNSLVEQALADTRGSGRGNRNDEKGSLPADYSQRMTYKVRPCSIICCAGPCVVLATGCMANDWECPVSGWSAMMLWTK